MITAVYKHQGQVHAMCLESAGVLADSFSGLLIVEAPTDYELADIADELQIDAGNLIDAMDPNEAPRLEIHDKYDYLYVRVPSVNRQTKVVSTVPMLAAYDNQRLILISSEKLKPILTGGSKIKDMIAGGSVASVLATTLNKVIDSYDYHIKEQTNAIHAMVNKIQEHKLESEDFSSFVILEDQIDSFVSALTPMVPVINRLPLSVKNDNIAKSDQDLFDDAALAAQQSINMCQANSNRISNIRGAYETMSNNSLNRTMKTLTIATLLIAAPNLIFSMYGMNIHLPMQWNEFGFGIVVGLAITAIVIVVLWAKKRKLF